LQQYLAVTNFNFSIPTNAVIKGIMATARGYGQTNIRDNSLTLTPADNKANFTITMKNFSKIRCKHKISLKIFEIRAAWRRF